MKRYVIERDLPGVGKLNQEQLKGAAAKSNDALAKLSGEVQWVQSYVVDEPSASTWPKAKAPCRSTPA